MSGCGTITEEWANRRSVNAFYCRRGSDVFHCRLLGLGALAFVVTSGLSTPRMVGQDAFGAIREIARIIDADPKTDWSKVDLRGLRQHLIDMNEVTLKADAVAKPVDGGLEIAVTGSDRTLIAIQRMVSAQAREINDLNGWSAKAATLPNGVLLTVTAADPKEVQHVRGLSFIGLLVSGSHHQPHLPAMAKSEFAHSHWHRMPSGGACFRDYDR